MTVRNIVRLLRTALSEHNESEANRLFRLGFDTDGEALLAEIKKQGCFRSSKDGFDIKTIIALVNEQLRVNIGKLSSQWVRYLESVKALLYISASVRKVYVMMLDGIKKTAITVKGTPGMRGDLLA